MSTNSTFTAQVFTLSSNLTKANLEISKLKIAVAVSKSASKSINAPNWDPTDYCWLHGFKAKVGHTRLTVLAKIPKTGRYTTKD